MIIAQGQLFGLLCGVARGEDLEAEVARIGRRAGLLGLRGLRLSKTQELGSRTLGDLQPISVYVYLYMCI